MDGKTINKNTPVTFLINSPKVAQVFEGRAFAKVVFTTPAGGKTTYFGEIDTDTATFHASLCSLRKPLQVQATSMAPQQPEPGPLGQNT